MADVLLLGVARPGNILFVWFVQGLPYGVDAANKVVAGSQDIQNPGSHSSHDVHVGHHIR
jgi:hypothetical protein